MIRNLRHERVNDVLILCVTRIFNVKTDRSVDKANSKISQFKFASFAFIIIKELPCFN